MYRDNCNFLFPRGSSNGIRELFPSLKGLLAPLTTSVALPVLPHLPTVASSHTSHLKFYGLFPCS